MCARNTENEKGKKVAKHKPESRKKYEKNNPNWTVRMPLSWHEEYEIYVKKFGLSRREFMGVSLEKIKLNFEQIRTQAYNEGFAVGRKQGHQEGYAEGETTGYNKGREEGFAEGKHVGIDQGKGEWGIWYLCCICGGFIYVKPNSEEHNEIVDFFDYRGWAHLDCANRRFYR